MTDNGQNAATPGGMAELVTGRPTLAGPIPPAFASRFQPSEAGLLPEFCKLPRPRERCPYTGASRTWLLEHGDAGHFKLVRIRKAGSVRGAIFVHLPSLLAFIRGAMEKQSTGGGAQ